MIVMNTSEKQRLVVIINGEESCGNWPAPDSWRKW